MDTSKPPSALKKTHQIEQKPNNFGFPRLRREKQGGHSVVAGGQGSRPRCVQRLAHVQETAVRGVVQRAIPRAELRVVGGVCQVRVIL